MESESGVCSTHRKAKRTHSSASDTEEDSKQRPPSLPEDIIVDILSRLPVDTLLRFRCVSKSWRSLISSPQFTKIHLDMLMNYNDCSRYKLILSYIPECASLKSCSLYSLLYEPPVNASELKVDFLMKDPYDAGGLVDACNGSYDSGRLVGSCNGSYDSGGLVGSCNGSYDSGGLVGSCNGLFCITIEDDIFLWNPATRKSKKLPDVGVKLRVECYRVYGLVIFRSNVVFGFGFDERTDDYKVVGILSMVRDGCLYENEVNVYTLRSDSWRRIEGIPSGIPLDDLGKFANGALHWAVGRGIGPSHWAIVSLDLGKETYSEVVLPNFRGGQLDLTLGVLRGSLCVLCNYHGSCADIWVMKEYGVKESWTKLASIPYFTDHELFWYSTPIFVSKDGEVLLECKSGLILYKSKDKTFSYPEIHSVGTFVEVDLYVESLVLPNVDARGER